MKLRLKQNEVVHCRTEKEAIKVLKIADKCSFKWENGSSYLDINGWDTYKENTCCFLHLGQYDSINVASKEYSIITAKEFIKRHKKHKLKQDILSLQQAHNDLLERFNSFDKPSIKCQESKVQVLGSVNPKTKEYWLFDKYNKILHIKVDSLTVEKEERKSGWYKYEDTKYLMYHDFKNNIKFGFNAVNTWQEKLYLELTTGYTKATDEEVLRRLTEEAKRRGLTDLNNVDLISTKGVRYDKGSFIFNGNDYEIFGIYFELDGVTIMDNGKWAEVVKPYEPKVGDVVKAWYKDSFKFIYGVITRIDDSDVPFEISHYFWASKVEPAPEEVVKHFKTKDDE